MWQKWMTRVRGVMARSKRSARSSSEGGGVGNEMVLSTMPSRRSRCFQVVIMRG